MIKIENTEVFGWEAAIRGMRNPLNSWDNSDSFIVTKEEMPRDDTDGCLTTVYCNGGIGTKDLELMKTLVKAGSDHSKFMRMINVTLDITAPLYWWKEFDTYKVGTVRNSCSTMHKICAKEFIIDDFSHEHLNTAGIDILERSISALNEWREYFVYGFDSCEYRIEKGDKEQWWQIIQLLPSSYNQRATVQLNYAVLRNMYHSRKNHKLDEWREFCTWIETLPFSDLIIGGE